MTQEFLRISWTCAFFMVLGCKSMDRFDTRKGETYCGSLVGQGVISAGFEEPEWLGSGTQQTLELSLNTAELAAKDGVPAIITSHDATFGPCAPRPLFERAKVRTLGAVLGDRLGAVQLNDDHEEDVVSLVDSTCSGSMVGILSLIKNGEVEMRLLRPAPENAADVNPTAESTTRFGLFTLRKTAEGCSL